MARKHSLNLREAYFNLDLSGDTNTVTRSLGVLVRDWKRVMAASFTHQVAGVGAQNVTYQLKVGSTNLCPVTGNVANATKDATASVGPGDNQAASVEGARLDVTATYAAGVTNGAKVTIHIIYVG